MCSKWVPNTLSAFDTLSAFVKIVPMNQLGSGDPSLGAGTDLVCGRLAASDVVAEGAARETELTGLQSPSM